MKRPSPRGCRSPTSNSSMASWFLHAKCSYDIRLGINKAIHSRVGLPLHEFAFDALTMGNIDGTYLLYAASFMVRVPPDFLPRHQATSHANLQSRHVRGAVSAGLTPRRSLWPMPSFRLHSCHKVDDCCCLGILWLDATEGGGVSLWGWLHVAGCTPA